MRATRWRKLGRIYEPAGVHGKLLTHAANPLAVHRQLDIYRIFFSGRDEQNRSSVGFFDLDVVRRKVVAVCDEPAFVHGAEGSFHSHGVSIGTCYDTPEARLMLFMGWHIPSSGHWRGEIGALKLEADLSLTLALSEPMLALTDDDPVSLSYPWVLPSASKGYRMWYGSTCSWDAGNGEMLHVINGATSRDGVTWRREGEAIPHIMGTAQAFSRPTVLQGDDGALRMWFSYRGAPGRTYRIGEAACDEAGRWTLLLDRPGIDISRQGWDGEMIEYPFVFRHGDETYMLYNGNGFGRSGIGLAVADGYV